MAAIVCELCGSVDVVKQDGYFICQHCGTKYTLDEARKLIGTVKIDKTDDTEKLLVLARRARDDNNSENAEKYYGLILQDDPNNWEAAFFQVYFHSMQCKIVNISSAAYDVANCMDSTLRLIYELGDEEEKGTAIDTVVQYSISITTTLADAANNHYNRHALADGAPNEMRGRIHASKEILTELEKVLKKYSCDDSFIVSVQKAQLEFLDKYQFWFLADYKQELLRLSTEIKARDSSYELPEKKSGCYVATAVYGSYDCPQVWTLRRYRDYTLAETWYGRAFVHTYYTFSPTLVKWFGETEWFKNMWKPKLDKMVKELNEKGVADTPYQDRNW